MENTISVPVFLQVFVALYIVYFISNLLYDLFYKKRAKDTIESSIEFSSYVVDQEQPEKIMVAEMPLSDLPESLLLDSVPDPHQVMEQTTQQVYNQNAFLENGTDALLLREESTLVQRDSAGENDGNSLSKPLDGIEEILGTHRAYLGGDCDFPETLTLSQQYRVSSVSTAELESTTGLAMQQAETKMVRFAKKNLDNGADIVKSVANNTAEDRHSLPRMIVEGSGMDKLFVDSDRGQNPSQQDQLAEKKIKWKKLLELSQTSIEIQNKDGQITYRSLLNTKTD